MALFIILLQYKNRFLVEYIQGRWNRWSKWRNCFTGIQRFYYREIFSILDVWKGKFFVLHRKKQLWHNFWITFIIEWTSNRCNSKNSQVHVHSTTEIQKTQTQRPSFIRKRILTRRCLRQVSVLRYEQFFRQIESFRRFHLAFVFGLQTI